MKQYLSILFLLCYGTVFSYPAIIPTPQKIEFGKTIKISSNRIQINFPAQGFKAKSFAQKLLKKKINMESKSPEVIIDLKFDLNLTKPESYKINYSKKAGIHNMVITGATTKALVYGLMTLEQLIEKKANDKVSLSLAKVYDYPCWNNRFLGNYSIFVPKNLELAARYKFGGVAFQFRSEWRRLKPDTALRGSFKNYREAFGLMKQYSDMEVLDFMLVYHIYAVRKKRTSPIFNIANEEDIAGLIERCKFAVENGINQIMICADDWTPMKNGIYVCPHKEERAKFGLCAGKAHGILMTRLYDALKKSYPKLKFSFCPAVYSLEGHNAESPKMAMYLKDLSANLTKEVPVVWTGNKIISRNITADHYKRFSKLLNGHKTMIWDNSDCYVYPIHQWKTAIAPEVAAASSSIFVNTKSFDGGIWKTLFAVNANDFLWNPKSYNSAESYKTVFRRFFPTGDYQLVRTFQNNFDKLRKMTSDNYDKQLMAQLKQQKQTIDKTINKNRWFNMRFERLKQKLESKRPTAYVKLISHPPVIDGNDNDPCYSSMPENILIERHGKTVPAKMRTTFKLGFDRENIYVFIKANWVKPIKGAQKLRTKVDLFSQPDVLEMFIKPTAGKKYIQIACDPEGYKYNRLSGEQNWNPNWKLKVIKGTDHWCVEIAIPFKMLKDAGAVPPSDKVQWKGNICREYHAEKSIQCWSPTYANRFLESAMFGTFEFKE